MIALFPLTDEDKGQLTRLNANKSAIFALKKLFLNTATSSKVTSEVNVLAAERVALTIIQNAFYELSVLRPESNSDLKEENMV